MQFSFSTTKIDTGLRITLELPHKIIKKDLDSERGQDSFKYCGGLWDHESFLPLRHPFIMIMQACGSNNNANQLGVALEFWLVTINPFYVLLI